MADDTIRISTEFDLSNLRSGMAEAQSVVKSSTAQMSAAYERVAQATLDYAAKQNVLRDAIRQNMTGALPYAEAMKVLPPILQENNAASQALTAAKKELASAARSEAGAEDAVAVSTRGVTSSYYAAQGAAGLLEGRIPFRAMERFLASSQAVSGVLMSAFPVIGALALGGILVDVTTKIVKFTEDASDLARETGSDWLTGAIGQFDGLKEAMKQADDVLLSVARDMDELRTKSNSLDIEKIRLTQGDAAAYRAQAAQEKSYVTAQTGILEPLQGERSQLQAQLAAADIRRSPVTGGEVSMSERNFMTPSQIAQARARLKELDGQIESINGHIATANQQIEIFGLEAQKADEAANRKGERSGESAANKAAAAERKAQEEKIRADREALDAARSTHAMTEIDESNFWLNIAALAKYGSLEYVTAIDEAHKATARAQQEDAEKLKSYDLVSYWDELTKADQEATKSQDALNLAMAEASGEIKAAQDKVAESLDLEAIRASEAVGGMTKLAAAQAEARVHAQAYREELARLDAEITKVNEDESLTPQEKVEKNGRLQAQKIQLQGQAQTSNIQDAAAITQQIESPYLKAFDNINSAWLRVQDQMFYSTRNIGLEFAKMGQSIVISFTNMGEQMVLKAAEHDLLMLAHHQTTNIAKLGSDAQYHAASDAMSQASEIKKLALDLISLFRHTSHNAVKLGSDVATYTASASAKVAADGVKTASGAAAAAAQTAQAVAAVATNAAAAESFAGLAAAEAAAQAAPAGVIAAIAAGTAMYAAMTPYVVAASLDTGTGYVPRDGLAAIHQGEIIVPAPTADELRNGGGGGAINVSQENHFHGFNPDKQFQQQLDRNAAHVAKAVQKHMRQGGRG